MKKRKIQTGKKTETDGKKNIQKTVVEIMFETRIKRERRRESIHTDRQTVK